MLGLGLIINRAGRSLLTVIRSGLQMWLGFTKVNVIGKELLPLAGSFSNAGNAIMELLNQNNYSASSDGNQATVRPRLNIATTTGSTYILIITPNPNSTPTGTIKGKLYDGSEYVFTNYDFTNVKEFTFKSNGSVNFNLNGSNVFDTGEFSVSVKEISQFTPDKSLNTNNAKLLTGKALSFDGTNDKVVIGNPNINLKSICFWVNLSTTSEQIFNLTSSQNIKAVNGTITLGGTWSNSNIYVNSVATATIGTTLTRVVITTDTNILVNDLEFAKIGSDYGALILSDVQIYDAQLTLADAVIDYNNPNDLVFKKGGSIALSNLKGYYALSEGDGSITYDSSGSGKNGAISGATYVLKQPIIPQLGMVDWSKSSNLIAFSDDVTGTGWSTPSDGDDGEDPVVTLNHGISPTGVQNAARVVFDIGSSTISADFSQLQYSITVEDEKDYNTSLYIKSNDSNDYTLAFLDIDGTRTNITANQSWQRYNVSGTAIDTSQFFKLRIRGNESTSKNADVLIYGPQVKLGPLGSYITTAGSAAIDATLIQNPNDLGKDVLGNTLRLRDGAFNLDGSGYAEVANDSSLVMTEGFSVGFWTKLTPEASGIHQTCIAKGAGLGTNANNGMAISIFSNKIYFDVNASTRFGVNTPAQAMDNSWLFVTATYTKLEKVRLYLNNLAPVVHASNLSGTIHEDHPVTIGANKDVTHKLLSQIDETIWYDRPLSAKEILNNYKAGLSKHS